MGRGMFSYTQKLIDSANLVLGFAGEENLDLQSALHNTAGAIALCLSNPAQGLQSNEKFKEVQDRLFKRTGVETTKLAAAYSELGMAHVLCGNSSNEVLNLFQESEDIRRRINGFVQVNLFSTLRGKGYVHILRGNFQEAYLVLMSALNDRKLQFGQDHTNMGGR